jgi:hypothetical protein
VALWVLQNANKDLVVDNLAQILGTTEGFTVDGAGRVELTFTPSGPANLILRLADSPVNVAIRGEDAEYPLGVDDLRLKSMAGTTVFDMYPGTSVIEVVYDVTFCGGKGYWVEGTGDPPPRVEFPRYVNLYHELWHAEDLLAQRVAIGPDNIHFLDPEASPIAAENLLRKRDNLAERGGKGGGCGPNQSTFPPPTSSSGCFVATAAFGSPVHPYVVSLRQFRDDVLRRTRTGQRFWDDFFPRYEQVSVPVIEAMNRDPRLLELVRTGIVTPLVHYLEIVRAFPDADVDAAGPEWSGFLTTLRDMLDEFAAALPRPTDFTGRTIDEAVNEIAVFARYSFHTSAARRAWLAELVATGALPLDVAGREHARLAAVLAADGRDDEEISMILGPTMQSGGSAARRRPQMLCGFGESNLIRRSDFTPGEWIYTVDILNTTTDTFDEIVVMMKRVNQTGIVFFVNEGVAPGDTAQYFLGLCRDVESYVVGFYIGNTEVAKFPAEGNLTPALASQLKPADTDPCADSWLIE